MKLLNGSELTGYISERQAKQVRVLRQSHGVAPKMVVVRANSDMDSDSLTSVNKNYATGISVDLEIANVENSQIINEISKFNSDSSVHGIVVQLSPTDSQTDNILNVVTPGKDVAGLGENTTFDTPTPLAIDWLLAGYNVDLRGKNIVIVGQGREVALPLAKRWQNSGLDPRLTTEKDQNLAELLRGADVLIISSELPGLKISELVKENAVIVDASGAVDNSDSIGDIATCALFDNVIRSAQASIKESV